MEYNDIFNDIPQSYFDHILREKRGKMNLEHFVNSGYNEWMSESNLAAIELTEEEMFKYSNYYYSRVVNMPKKIDISSLRTNFVDGESYENEYNAIQNFASQLNLKYDINIAHIDITNQEIMYYDNSWNELTIDISQEVFFKDYLSQLTLNNTYDVTGINPYKIALYTSDGDRNITPDNGYICKVQLPS